jgi:hypothetical protein
LNESARSVKFAIHAVKSDIGARDEKVALNMKSYDPYSDSAFLRFRYTDETTEAYRRGATLLGGILSNLEVKGTASTRQHAPLRPNISSTIEYNRHKAREDLIKLIEQSTNENPILETIIVDESASLADSKSVLSVGERLQDSSQISIASETSFKMIQHKPIMSKGDKRSVQSKRRSSALSVALEKSVESNNHLIELKFEPSALPTKFLNPSIDNTTNQMIRNVDKEGKASLFHIDRENSTFLSLKLLHRKNIQIEKSRNIERKRRLLNEVQGRRKIPVNDPPNVYDYLATRIQTLIRGWLGRVYSKWYQSSSVGLIVTIQRIVRGWLTRKHLTMTRLREIMALHIQRVYRGWKSRVSGFSRLVICYQTKTLVDYQLRVFDEKRCFAGCCSNTEGV